MIPKELSIYSYEDVASLLRAVYEARKRQRSTFSFGVWARELSLSNPSFVRHWVTGRRSLSPEHQVRVADHLELSEGERAYLELLVKRSKLRSKEAQETTDAEIRALRASLAERPEIRDHEAFVTDPLCPKILVLLSLRSEGLELAQIVDILESNRKDAEVALVTLARLDLVGSRSTDDMRLIWQARVPSFKISDQVRSDRIQQFHRSSLSKAIDSLSLPVDERYFKSYFLVLPLESYTVLCREISEAMSRVINRYGKKLKGNSRLYQLNFNVVPQSRVIREKN